VELSRRRETSKPETPAASPEASPAAAPIRLPDAGLAEDILAALADGGSGIVPAFEPEPLASLSPLSPLSPLLAGPDRLYALADRLASGAQRVAEVAPEEPEVWVTFGAGGEIYAVPVEHVEEVLRVTAITRLPYAPAPVRGITHHRGRVLTVLDLPARLGLPEAALTPKSRIAVVSSRGRSIGLLVDSAFQVVKLLRSGVQAPPADVMTERSRFLIGVYRAEIGLLILLDVDRVLTLEPDGKQHEEVGDEAPAGPASAPDARSDARSEAR
jgi:purine-binding chemotaxis protein CheW